MWLSRRPSGRLALASLLTLFSLGGPGCQKESPLATKGIKECGTVNITPGNDSVKPSVNVEVCAIAPRETITWVCDISSNSDCKGWQVIFEDRSVDDTKLFTGGATMFPSQPSDTTSRASATLVDTLVPNANDIILVKYTVRNGKGNTYDPHIVPMGP
jgi:hypothetical protein